MLTDHGTKVVKIMLHISPEYQLERIKNRLTKPNKAWKFRASDLQERKLWADYMVAFEKTLEHCSTSYAPWYVVPSEKKWFRYLIVSEIILQALKDMNPKIPKADFDTEILMSSELLQ